MRNNNVPEYELLGYFWKILRDDISGNGCPDYENLLRGPSYRDSVIIERNRLKQEARVFLDTPEFDNWADLSGADPNALREDLLHAYVYSK